MNFNSRLYIVKFYNQKIILILLFLTIGCTSSVLHAQDHKAILKEIDSALAAYNTKEVFNLIQANSNNLQDPVLMVEYKIRELHGLEKLEAYDESIELSNTLIKEFNLSPEQELEVQLLRALVYEILGDLDKAEEFLKKSKRLIDNFVAPEDPTHKLIGRYYIRNSSFYRISYYKTQVEVFKNKYIEYANKGLEFGLKYGYKGIAANGNMLLSFSPDISKQDRISYVTSALNAWKQMGDNHGTSAMYMALSNQNLDNKQIAVAYSDSAISSSYDSKLPGTKALAYQHRYQLFDRFKNPDSALVNHILYKNYADEVNLSNKEISVERINRKVDLEAKKLRTHILEGDIKRERQRNIVLTIIAIVMVILFLSLSYLYYRLIDSKKNIAQNEKILSKNLSEKTLLLTELNHRVKNNLSLILSLMQLQRGKEAPTQEDWEHLERRINALAMAHSLYTYSDENIKGSTINLNTYLSAIKKSNCKLILENIEFNLNFSDEEVSVESALPIGMIFNELMNNSIQHAVTDNQPLKISFSVSLENGVFALDYKDNGRIFDENAKESTGFFIIHALVRQLQGSMRRRKSHFQITLIKR